jgi:hypothetical protein
MVPVPWAPAVRPMQLTTTAREDRLLREFQVHITPQKRPT